MLTHHFLSLRVPYLLLICAVFAPLLGGCATIRVTDPPRTATEQFLLSQAAAQAVQQLSTTALRDRLVYVDPTFYETVDEPYVIGELRAHLLLNGVRLTGQRDAAQIVLEVRSRGMGVDRYDYLLGVPPVLIPAGSAGPLESDGGGTLVTPELAFLKSITQRGYSSVAYVAYWADTGEVVASSGPFVGSTYREDWWYFGVGPRTTGDIPSVEEEP